MPKSCAAVCNDTDKLCAFTHRIIGEEDETFAPIDDVITSTSYGFSFDSFVFRGEGSRVYLQCNVYVCSPQYILDHPDTCKTPVSMLAVNID